MGVIQIHQDRLTFAFTTDVLSSKLIGTGLFNPCVFCSCETKTCWVLPASGTQFVKKPTFHISLSKEYYWHPHNSPVLFGKLLAFIYRQFHISTWNAWAYSSCLSHMWMFIRNVFRVSSAFVFSLFFTIHEWNSQFKFAFVQILASYGPPGCMWISVTNGRLLPRLSREWQPAFRRIGMSSLPGV